MSSRVRNGVLIALIAALAILPLVIFKHGTDGIRVDQFRGTDELATTAVRTLAPDYKPWFNSVFKTPGSETETLLFAVQAAIGAGFLGYYIIYSRTRAKRNTLKPVAVPGIQEPCTKEFVFCEKTAENKF